MKDIAKTVEDIIEKYGCADPFSICEQMDIQVIDQPLPDSINGFTITLEDIRFIVLNNMLEHYKRRITAAHELGHIILHGTTNTIQLSANTSFCISRYEREADCFAAHLLLSEEMELFENEAVTARELSMKTHIPLDMIESSAECLRSRFTL